MITRGNDAEVAKRQFIAAFKNDPIQIRSQYSWSERIPSITQRTGIPPTFAALYLSLLAASADDNTFDDGNFRSRFSSLVGSPDLTSFSFSDLPKLWSHFAEWTRSRQTASRDCAQLLLPDPQREKLIGQSKRLAFPTYRDEVQLRDVLRKSGLDADSSFESVTHAVHLRLDSFGRSFREELNAFHHLVVKRCQLEAYESPFWGAIRDISQEHEEVHVKSYGRFCVVLDAADPKYPEFSLLTDNLGLQSLAEQERIELDRPCGNYLLLWRDPSGTMAIDAIALLATRHREFAKSRPGAALAGGWLALFPDQIGCLTTDGNYYEGGPVALVARRGHAEALASICRSLGIRWLCASAHEDPGEWKTMVFRSISRTSLDRLVALLPDGAKRLVMKGWRPPQPNFSGGAWFGQALLLNPASNPIVRLEGCGSGRYCLLDAVGDEIASGSLTATADDGLHIPSASLTDPRGVASCRYEFDLKTGGGRMVEMPVVTEIPFLRSRQIKDRSEWLTDGYAGSLVRLDDVYSIDARAAGAAHPSPFIGRWPLLAATSKLAFASCAPTEQCLPPQPFRWLGEALTLRYWKRESLPFVELRTHLEMVAAVSDVSPWKIRRLLLAACWLRTVERRTSPYPTLILADRMISSKNVDGRVVARISGMISEAELCYIEAALLPTERLARLGSLDVPAAIGSLEVTFDSEDRAREVANRHGLSWLEPAAAWNPMAGMLHPISDIFFHKAIRLNLPLEEWDPARRLWLEPQYLTQEPLAGTLLKSQGNQRNTYWIKSKSGYFATDSSAWAWLVHAHEIEGSLGSIAANGDAAWSQRVMSLPDPLCRWWLHWGGGCIGIDAAGGLLFLGGAARTTWDGVAYRAVDHILTRKNLKQALERRSLALKIRRGSPR